MYTLKKKGCTHVLQGYIICTLSDGGAQRWHSCKAMSSLASRHLLTAVTWPGLEVRLGLLKLGLQDGQSQRHSATRVEKVCCSARCQCSQGHSASIQWCF